MPAFIHPCGAVGVILRGQHATAFPLVAHRGARKLEFPEALAERRLLLLRKVVLSGEDENTFGSFIGAAFKVPYLPFHPYGQLLWGSSST